MKIVIFGANGATGRLLTAQALAAGHQVAAVTRRPGGFPITHERLSVVEADIHDANAAVAVHRARRHGADGHRGVLAAAYGGNPPLDTRRGRTGRADPPGWLGQVHGEHAHRVPSSPRRGRSGERIPPAPWQLVLATPCQAPRHRTPLSGAGLGADS